MFFQIVTNIQTIFQFTTEKKSIYKWTCAVQTRVVQGSAVIYSVGPLSLSMIMLRGICVEMCSNSTLLFIAE